MSMQFLPVYLLNLDEFQFLPKGAWLMQVLVYLLVQCVYFSPMCFNVHWIPFDSEMVKIIWNVHNIQFQSNLNFGTIWGEFSYKPQNFHKWNEYSLTKEKAPSGSTSTNLVELFRTFLEDGREILQIMVRCICHFLQIVLFVF